MSKTLTLLYFQHDGEAAKAEAAKRRRGPNNCFIRDVTVSKELEIEPCDRVAIMPDVQAEYVAKIEAGYGSKVEGSREEPQTDNNDNTQQDDTGSKPDTAGDEAVRRAERATGRRR